LVSRYLRKEKWSEYGFKSVQLKRVLLAIVIGFGFAAIGNYLLEPLVSKLTGESADLSTFQNVKGNLKGFSELLAVGWIIGGFFEEFFFRGYLLNRINLTALSKWIGIALTSVAFAHGYQGVGGVINTFYFAVVLGWLYYYFDKNVWYVMLVHGCFDTFGIVYLFLGL
jgi:membrane protease YdiL (CAAX protease family)